MKILVTGAAGQIGSELLPTLSKKYGEDNVISLDLRPLDSKHHEVGDATDKSFLESIIKKYSITEIYHLVGILSAKGEQNPDLAYNVNMNSLKNILDIAKELKMKIFWPSSIAAFGPTTPKDNTPQRTVLEPGTMYGITKVAGELLASYYFHKYGVDVRSLRYPGVIGWKAPPGGGTTDYAVNIFHEALKEKKFSCFLKPGTYLPMMHIEDAVRATIELMGADGSKLSVRTSYNISAISFSPDEVAAEIKKHIPEFEITYAPDFRQQIAESWPNSIDDSSARKDWNWKHHYDLPKLVENMITNLKGHR
ncbi:MAG: NAD-dependent epimerase/dehydratase family protein [Candidatus Micrarchaeota archaeon]